MRRTTYLVTGLSPFDVPALKWGILRVQPGPAAATFVVGVAGWFSDRVLTGNALSNAFTRFLIS